MDQALLDRILARAERIRDHRDNHGWPEPRTVEDLRNDPRVQLRNHLKGEAENLELAVALMLVVAEDYAALESALVGI